MGEEVGGSAPVCADLRRNDDPVSEFAVLGVEVKFISAL